MLLKRLDSITIGQYIVFTESETIYELEITGEKKTLQRFPGEGKRTLRKDNEELNIIGNFMIVVGEPAVFVLEPLGIFGNCTIRTTTRVQKIERIN
ncbi:hypothetical protein [Sporolactobacillus sp. KGMB 08714]|uniref:hypothetical protein n=1 Tax=Sporolactobacillus sp. KGMB 08714 TaxID=3064704 RepID=UPI002FBE8CFF